MSANKLKRENNEKIWLIDMGDDIVWCNEPDPSGHVEEEDATGYVRMDIHQATINTLCDACKCAANTLIALGEEDGFTGSQLQIDKLLALAKQHKQG